jgi:hypothetical protein
LGPGPGSQEIISGKMSEFQGSASTLFNAKGMNGTSVTI